MSSGLAKERGTTRNVMINIRAQQQQRDLIDQAAEVIGKNRSDFMLEAACQRANDILLDQRVFHLSDQQWQAFIAILDAPVQPNEKLRRLLHTPAPWDV